MKPRKNMSIRRKQMLIMMATSSVVLLLACAAFSIYEVIAFREAMKQNLATVADMVDHNTTAALDFNDPKSAQETLSALQAEPDIIGAWLYTKDGQNFAKYDRENDEIVFTPPAILPNGTVFSGQRLILCRPIVIKGETVGTLYLESDMQALNSRLIRYVWIVTLIFFVSWLIAFALSSWLQRLVSDPILHLVQVAHQVAQGKNYSLRATKQSDDELGQLVDGFNDMLAQIQQRDGALQSARIELEGRVVERTAELAKTNDDLRAENADRRRAEMALKESQLRYRLLFENMLEGYAFCRMLFQQDQWQDFVYLEVNSAFETLTGLKDVIGKKVTEVIPGFKESNRELFEIYGRVTLTGKPERCETYLKSLGIWFSVAVYSHEKNHFVVVFDNITKRKLAEESLRLLGSAVEQSKESILITNAELDLPGPKILFVNPAFTEMTGYTAEEAIGNTPRILQGPLTDKTVLHRLRQNLQRGDDFAGEAINYRKDGMQFTLEWQIAPIRDVGGNITHFVALQRDITGRKLDEAKLEQVHKQLLETSRRVGMAEVATNVLHNVGNVLNSVNVSASIVADAVKKSKAADIAKVAALLGEHTHDLGTFFSDDAKGKQLPVYLSRLSEHVLADQKQTIQELDLLLKNIEHIKDIVTTQQSYARVSGVEEIINVRELVEDSLRMNASALGRHGVGITREFEEVPLINVDRHKVLQVLVNLIRNAKHACQDSEREDKRLILRVCNVDGWIKISVADNGVGIPPENLIRIFNHGFTTRTKGHGFGLHSGALAAQQMHGSLTVQSDGIGHGAIFTLMLPNTTTEGSNG